MLPLHSHCHPRARARARAQAQSKWDFAPLIIIDMTESGKDGERARTAKEGEGRVEKATGKLSVVHTSGSTRYNVRHDY